MKYPTTADKVIPILERELGEKMDPTSRELRTEILVPIANEAHQQGSRGLPLEPFDLVEGWKKHYGFEPSKKIAHLFEKVTQFQKDIYEQGKRDALMGAK